MSCATRTENISALLDGELDPIEERRLLDHLGVCESCRRERERLRRLSRTLSGFDAGVRPPAAPDFVDVVVARAVAPRPRARRLSLPRFPVSLAAAAALLLLVGLASALLATLASGPGIPDAPPPVSDALAVYRERAAAVEPGDAGGHLVLARWCRESGLPDRAVREYVRALGADPSLEEARNALAELLPRRPETGSDLLVEIPDLPDLGPELPGRRLRAPTREELLAAVGLSPSGGRWLTEEAKRGIREHREGEEILARRAEMKARIAAAEPAPSGTDPLTTFLASLSPAEPLSHDSLSVVPLLDGDGSAGVDLLSVDDAFREGLLAVSEDVTHGRLSAQNLDPKRHVFLAAGRILRGGHQDRMLLRSVLLPPRTTARIPVVCCEKERWVGPSPEFEDSPGVAPPGIRRLLLGAEDQDAIWARISAQLAVLGAENRTEALRFALSRGRGPRVVREAERALAAAFEDERAVGFLVFARGRFLGGEVFADHELFRRLAPDYLRGYALEAELVSFEAGPEVTAPAPAALLDAVARSTFYPGRGVGSGEETEFVGGVSGHAILPVAGARPLHVSLFPGEADRPRGEEPPPAPAPSETEDAERPAPPPVGEPEGGQEDRVNQRRGKSGLGGKKFEAPKAGEVPGAPRREPPDTGGDRERKIPGSSDTTRPRGRDAIEIPRR